MKEESWTCDCFDIMLAIVGLLGEELTKKTDEFPCKRLDTGKGTDQHQSARLYLLHQLQSNTSSYRSSHDYNVLLFESKLSRDIIVNILTIFLYDL